MKKKILIILASVLLLATLFCAATLTSSAEDAEPELSISATALLIQNSVDIRYFVVAENVANINDVKLLVWNEPQENYVKGTEYAQVEYSGKGAPYQGVMEYYYDFEGVNAKMMADVFYAVPYVNVNGKDYYGTVKKYSVLEYSYSKMGKLDKAATTDTKLINMLDVMLDYGAMAQVYFDYKTDRLANDDFYQVKVSGGLLSDGFAKGLYLEGDEAVLTASAAPAGKSFVCWQNSAGDIVATTATATVKVGDKNDTYTAIYKAGLEYSENGSGYTVVGMGDSTDENLTIPSTYNGKRVTAIADGAFANSSSLVSVSIPATVEFIGASAFENCTSLKSVTFGENSLLETVENHAFYGCKGLTAVMLPANVENLGAGAFGGCNLLTSIEVENGSESYKSIDGHLYSFDGTLLVQYVAGSREASYDIIDGVTGVAPEAFAGASNLTTLTIPEGLVNIGNGAFLNCTALCDVYFEGTENAWVSVSIGENNNALLSANIYCTKHVGDGEWEEENEDTPIVK